MMAALMSQSIHAQQNTEGGQKQDRKERFNKETRNRPSAEQMVQMQSARLANELMLDDANAAKFKDIYQSYQKDLQAVRQKYHPKKQEQDEKPQMMERKELTDQQVEERILNQMKEQKEMLSVKENYYAKFRKVLSPKQIQKVYAHGNRGRMGGMRNANGNRRMQMGRFGQQNHQMGTMQGKKIIRGIHQGQKSQQPQAPLPTQEG